MVKLTEKQAQEFFRQNPVGQKQYDRPIGPQPAPKKEPAPAKKSAPDAESPASREPNKAGWRERITGAARSVKEKASRLNDRNTIQCW